MLRVAVLAYFLVAASAVAAGHSLPYLSSCFPSHSTYIRAVLKHSIDAVSSYGDPYASILLVGSQRSGLKHLLGVTADRLVTASAHGPAVIDLSRDTDAHSGSLLPVAANEMRGYLENVAGETGSGQEGETQLKMVIVHGLSALGPADSPRLNFLLRLLAGQKSQRAIIPVSDAEKGGQRDIEIAGKALYFLPFDLDEHAAWLESMKKEAKKGEEGGGEEGSAVNFKRVSSFLKAASRPVANPLAVAATTDGAASGGGGDEAPPDIRGSESLVKAYLHSLWANLTAVYNAAQAKAKETGVNVNAQARPLTPEAVIGRLQQVLLLKPSLPPGDWEGKAAQNERCKARPIGGKKQLGNIITILPPSVRSHLPADNGKAMMTVVALGGVLLVVAATLMFCLPKKASSPASPAAAQQKRKTGGDESTDEKRKKEKASKGKGKEEGSKKKKRATSESDASERDDEGDGSDDDDDSRSEEEEEVKGSASTASRQQEHQQHQQQQSSKTPNKPKTSASATGISSAAAPVPRQRAASGTGNAAQQKRKASE
jgi:hypothetical protein